MHSAFQYDRYLLRRQVLALTGKVRFYNPAGQVMLFCQQKMFKLKEDIRVFNDENRSQELLLIQARHIIDFSAAYDVIDSLNGQRVGALRRKGLRSMIRDAWEVLDNTEQVLAVLQEDSPGLALLRRLVLGNLLPQNYDLLVGETRVGDYKQRFHLFRYEMDVDFSMDTQRRIDRRLGVAAAVLLAIIEGRQDS